MFKEFSLGCLMVVSSHIIKKGKLAEMDTRCHSLYYSLSLVVPLVVTRCITRCHSLSFIVTRCHSLYYSLSLVVTRCHSMYYSSVFLKTIDQEWEIFRVLILCEHEHIARFSNLHRGRGSHVTLHALFYSML